MIAGQVALTTGEWLLVVLVFGGPITAVLIYAELTSWRDRQRARRRLERHRRNVRELDLTSRRRRW